MLPRDETNGKVNQASSRPDIRNQVRFPQATQGAAGKCRSRPQCGCALRSGEGRDGSGTPCGLETDTGCRKATRSGTAIWLEAFRIRMPCRSKRNSQCPRLPATVCARPRNLPRRRSKSRRTPRRIRTLRCGNLTPTSRRKSDRRAGGFPWEWSKVRFPRALRPPLP